MTYRAPWVVSPLEAARIRAIATATVEERTTTRRLFAQSGADPTGGAPVTALLQDLIDELEALGGGTIDLAHPLVRPVWLIDDSIEVAAGVNLLGDGNGIDGTGASAGVKFVCGSPTARIAYSGYTRGGLSGGFTIDGAGTGDPTGIFYTQTVQRGYRNITVQNGKAVNWYNDGSQNNYFIGVDVNGSVPPLSLGGTGTTALLWDGGVGGNVFIRCSITNADILFQTRATHTATYPWPTHNAFLHCIFENSNATATTLLDIRAATQLRFSDCLFSANNAITLSSGYVVKISNTDLGDPFLTIVQFDSCGFSGSTAMPDMFYVQGHNYVEFTGPTTVDYAAHLFATDGISRGSCTGQLLVGGHVTNWYNTLSGGSFTAWFIDLPMGHNFKLDDANTWAVIAGRKADATQRYILTRDGVMAWYNGTNTTIGASLTYDETTHSGEKSLTVTGGIRNGGRMARTPATYLNNTAGSTQAFDANFNLHEFAFTGAAGSLASTSITNATADSVITIMFIQSAAGGNTYAWPPQCRFAGGGSGPSDTTPNTATSVTFVRTHTNTLWIEIGRSVAVPTT